MAKEVMTKVNEFAAKLQEALGDNLVSLLLYGPAVRNEASRLLTILLIVRDASPAALRPIEADIAAWSKKGEPPPLIFAEREWRQSADVFPIEIEDMREAHLLLRGQDPLEGMETNKEDLRRELEREVRGKLLQLRTEFAASASNGRALSGLLVDTAATFFILFRAVLRLTGSTPPQEPGALVREVAEITGLDADAFDWVLAVLTGEKRSALRPYDPVGDRYVEQIERLANFVDSFDISGAADAHVTEARQ